MSARQGVYGWTKDPHRQAAARKAAATRDARDRSINILSRSYETRTGYLPLGHHLRFIIESVREGRTDTGVIDELLGDS